MGSTRRPRTYIIDRANIFDICAPTAGRAFIFFHFYFLFPFFLSLSLSLYSPVRTPILFNWSCTGTYDFHPYRQRGAGIGKGSDIKKIPLTRRSPTQPEDICLTKHTIKGSTRPEYIIIIIRSQKKRAVAYRPYIIIMRVRTRGGPNARTWCILLCAYCRPGRVPNKQTSEHVQTCLDAMAICPELYFGKKNYIFF